MASLAVAYQQQLRSNPLVTKSATSAALSVLGSFVASHIRGNPVKRKELAAFAIYGLTAGGPIPHFFFSNLARIIPSGTTTALVKQVLADRLVLAPVMTVAFFFITNVAKGMPPRDAWNLTCRLFVGVLKKNWVWWTPAVIVNMKFVPLEFKPVFGSLIAFVWTIYLALLSRKAPKPATGDPTPPGHKASA